MSVKQTNELWRRECEPLRMHLLHAICDCADDEGVAHPSIGYLVWKTNMARSTVTDYLRELRKERIIVPLGRRSELQPAIEGNSPSDTSVIQINLDPLPLKRAWKEIRRGSPASGLAGVRLADPGSPPQPGGVVRHTEWGSPPEGKRNKEEPSLEPSLEPYGGISNTPNEDRILEIARAYPKIGEPLHLARIVAEEIGKAIERHGFDLVLAETKRRVAGADPKFLPAPERFFSRSEYRVRLNQASGDSIPPSLSQKRREEMKRREAGD